MLCMLGILFLLAGCSTAEQGIGRDETHTQSVQKSEEQKSTEETEMVQESVVVNTEECFQQVPVEEILKEANLLISEKKYPQAIGLLTEIGGNPEARDLLKQLRYLIFGDYLANLNIGVAAITADGTVAISLNDETIYANGNYSVTEAWTDVKSLSYASEGIDARNSKGDFLTTIDEAWMQERTTRLELLSGVELISTSDSDFAVLDDHGELHVYNKNSSYLDDLRVQNEIRNWNNIVDVETGRETVVALHEDGTVSFVYGKKLSPYYEPAGNIYDNMTLWTNIVDISYYGMESVIGLKSDGTVVVSDSVPGAYGDYFEVEQWSDIIAISKSYFNVLGLKRDGTVVAVGSKSAQQKYVEDWTDIVAISAGDCFHFGLKADGTIVVTPAGESYEDSQLPDVSKLPDLYVPTIN